MEYNVDGWNNFCRVFELPDRFPSDFCFNGGIDVAFKMVDWFNPVPDLPQPAVTKEMWRERVGEIEIKRVSHEELCESLIPWLLGKQYVKEGRDYLVLCNFGAAIRFSMNDI